ncbi:TniQ family protein [Priestia flexa]|uniref:TniQ family protein n=1 Tax=Priestia flexa TaxID=86664 RepID=UPI0009ED65E3|nr:TniQ family protein [Priestia flexa]MED4588343.1 TniQ family protein [Priestia flexa]
MSKRTRTSKIDKWIKEGRGSGIGADYKPWLNIQDVSSVGRSTRLKGIKTGRQHEFLSDLERNYFYLTEYSDFVIDIREQFPLFPLEDTIVIADELGIKHPTDPYPDELIYSAISRFHFYSGNTSFVETLEELFQSRSLVPSIEFGSHFSTLVQNLGSNYSVESLLAQNTIYPYFAPFITIERQKKLFEDVSTNGQGIHGRLGISGGKISRKQGLFYCSKCANNDINIFGEPYVHREHQLQGIEYCPHHELTLKMYPVDYREFSRNGYIRFDRRQMDLSELQEIESCEFKEVQVKLAKMAYRLLQIPINQFSIEKVFKKYRTLLRENNWLMTNTRLKREELFRAFISKFPQGFFRKI